MVPSYLPWVGACDDDRPSSVSLDSNIRSLNRIVRAHVEATTLESFRPVASIARLGPLEQDLENTLEPDLEFHIVFFHMMALMEGTGNVGDLRNTAQFFNAPTVGMRKGCFTVIPPYILEQSQL